MTLYTNPNPKNLASFAGDDGRSMEKLESELAQLRGFPRLRSVKIDIWIPHRGDAYYDTWPLLARISHHLKSLKARIGAGLCVELLKAWRYESEVLDAYNVSWMWDGPDRTARDNALDGNATAEERIKVLIADGIGKDSPSTNLEKLPAAGSQLIQLKKEAREQGEWTVSMGISKRQWLQMKQKKSQKHRKSTPQ